ncbi:MAG: NAD-dependent epimerase/dehydratase family protein [Planctomycetota bacterium]|jgi:GDP-L-fucose synthase
MTLNGKRIFLAGASGMAGSAIMRLLLERYPDVSINAVRFSSKYPVASDPRVNWIRADLRLQDDCRRAVSGCDLAVMAAATSAGSLGMAAEPWRAVDDNVIMNTQMLEAFHGAAIKRAVLISSATVYQEFEGAVRESDLDMNSEPHSAYTGVGWGMRFLEKLCGFWHEKAGMEVLVARAANIYGPFAAFDPQRSNVIPALIRKSADKMDPFEVWGSPEVVRDVIFVEDLAEAVLRLLESESVKFGIFNVGSGKGAKLGRMVELVLEAAGHEPSKIKWSNDAPPTIRKRVLDCSKIRETLNWKAGVSLEEGIRKTTRWWVENRNEWKK